MCLNHSIINGFIYRLYELYLIDINGMVHLVHYNLEYTKLLIVSQPLNKFIGCNEETIVKFQLSQKRLCIMITLAICLQVFICVTFFFIANRWNQLKIDKFISKTSSPFKSSHSRLRRGSHSHHNKRSYRLGGSGGGGSRSSRSLNKSKYRSRSRSRSISKKSKSKTSSSQQKFSKNISTKRPSITSGSGTYDSSSKKTFTSTQCTPLMS